MPAAEERDQQPGHGGVLADDRLAHLLPDGEQPLAQRLVLRGAVGAGRRGCGRSSAAYLSVELGEFLGELDQSWVRARDGGVVGEQRADLLLAAAEVPGDGA